MKASSAIVLGAVLMTIVWAAVNGHTEKQTRVGKSISTRSSAVSNANQDIALVNLQCAAHLRNSEKKIDTHGDVQMLNRWAERVKMETERHLYRFRANPREFENSEGYFRMLMLAVVLYEDFGIRYNAKLISNPDQLAAQDRFFANPDDVFLTGLLGTNRTGTCSSMPVLYVTIGRRLGYPLKLVTTKAHLFVRWEGAGERFNVEATSKGLNRYDDEHYKRWPFPITEEEIRSDSYLKSLTPDEELALFLSIRGHCLKGAGRFSDAAESFAEAARLAPAFRGYRLLHQNALQLSHLGGKILP